MTFYYENGVMATAQSSILCHSDRMGSVWGTDGYMVCQNINNVEAIDVYDGNHTVVAHYDVPAQLTGYEYEVAAAAGRNRRSHRMQGNAPRRHPAHHGTHGFPAPRLEPHLPLRTLSSNISFSVGELRFRSNIRR